ncbi:hypothetical protein C0989_008934 [Termitomyces sp. Mn162]|nr:hypothetical protein C0989_008934 [Termitomyces sp. Mn162]
MSILSQFSRHIRAVKGKAASKTIRIAALFDSIVSTPGVTMPWKGMVEICHAEGITSIVDAAHSLGQEPINLSETQPDFWIGIGGEKRIIDYCHTLAIEGGKCVAEILGTEVMDMPEAPGELVGTMVYLIVDLM